MLRSLLPSKQSWTSDSFPPGDVSRLETKESYGSNDIEPWRSLFSCSRQNKSMLLNHKLKNLLISPVFREAEFQGSRDSLVNNVDIHLHQEGVIAKTASKWLVRLIGILTWRHSYYRGCGCYRRDRSA